MQYRLILSALIATGLLAGCGEGEPPAPGEEKTAVQEAMDRAAEETAKARDAAAEAAAAMAEAARIKGAELAEGASAEAGRLLERAEEYLSEGKTSLAAATLEQLQAIRGSLPESLQSQVDRLESALAAQTAETAPVEVPAAVEPLPVEPAPAEAPAEPAAAEPAPTEAQAEPAAAEPVPTEAPAEPTGEEPAAGEAPAEPAAEEPAGTGGFMGSMMDQARQAAEDVGEAASGIVESGMEAARSVTGAEEPAPTPSPGM